jgi:hypothetical protein
MIMSVCVVTALKERIVIPTCVILHRAKMANVNGKMEPTPATVLPVLRAKIVRMTSMNVWEKFAKTQARVKTRLTATVVNASQDTQELSVKSPFVTAILVTTTESVQ